MMDIIRRSLVLILFLVFLFSTQNYFILSLGTMNIICKPSERTALLSFKQHLNDSSNSLSSWSSENCCWWAGVVCSNTTHHVVQLQLSDLGLGGKLNPSLLALKQLRHLDLSWNHFDGTRIPDFLGSLQSLRYLNLSKAGFSGMIPPQLGNLSNLRYLDLRDSEALVGAGNFQWISHLSSLEHLDLSSVYLNASHCLQAISMLPSLLVLRLRFCSLSGALPSSLPYVNFTSLAVLDLSGNSLDSSLLEWLYSLTNLEQLDLRDNRFQDKISPSIGNLTKLTFLDLANNEFTGEISGILGSLSLLKKLYLSNNELNGSLPESLGNLSKLDTLDITENAFEGVVSEVHFANLTNLQSLSMNSIVLKVSPEWIPPFQLLIARLGSCRLGPEIPIWLRTQKSLTHIDLSSTGISGRIPSWFWNFTSTDHFSFDLSNNSLYGELPKVINARSISLKNNQLSGKLPRVTSNITELDLSNNSFSGPISTFLCNPPENNDLRWLDLSENLLSGNLSDCWVYWASLWILNLERNKITGKIPSSIGSLPSLVALYLRNNRLSGELPSSLKSCTSMRSIDIGENGFTGRLPIWLGESLSGLQYLQLRSNKFYGTIPQSISGLSSLSILDLSNNSFTGHISALACSPLRTEVNDLRVLDLSNNFLSGDLSECWLSWKSLVLLRLGSNNITGKIPSSMGSLFELKSLHLENNNLSGDLPLTLRNCTSLKMIDIGENGLTGRLPIWLGESFPDLIVLRLRQNKFNGEIPKELCDMMTSLQILDLAHNNLSGSIPRCFNNFIAMATRQKSYSLKATFEYANDVIYASYAIINYAKMEKISPFSGKYAETTSLVMKSMKFEYSNTLSLVTSMDLSNNSLSGEIPEELTSLIGLRFLNLSENRFTGKIPEKIGNMGLLESLDFSNNNISGAIPQSISGISTLSYLDLSYNNLSGKIPLGTQLQSFNESSFIGNQELCGPPLKINCSREDPPQKPGDRADEEDWFEMKWFYISMGVGFVVGFWAFCGVMVFKSSWRIAYFRFLDDTKDKLCLLF